MNTLSRADVAHLARLARLAVTDEELDLFAGQLDVVLDAVARVGEAAAEDVAPTTHAVPMTNVTPCPAAAFCSGCKSPREMSTAFSRKRAWISPATATSPPGFRRQIHVG